MRFIKNILASDDEALIWTLQDIPSVSSSYQNTSCAHRILETLACDSPWNFLSTFMQPFTFRGNFQDKDDFRCKGV